MHIFKPYGPNSTDKTLMNVARVLPLSFLVSHNTELHFWPLAGGIVEVVLSIAAVTGGARYGPAIWALFPKKAKQAKPFGESR